MTYTKLDLAKSVLESYVDEYKDLSDTWRALDTKAQGAGVLSGVFLAACFAWLRQLPPVFPLYDRALLTLTLVLLLLSIVATLWALSIATVSYPPRGESIKDMFGQVIGTDLTEDISVNWVLDSIELWNEANNQVHAANSKKAFRTAAAQICLVSATVPLAFMCFTMMFPEVVCSA